MKGKSGYSGTGILFPLLEAPELALDCKGGLLCLWCRQVDVNFFLLLGLLNAARFPFFLRVRGLAGCWRCFGVKLEEKNNNVRDKWKHEGAASSDLYARSSFPTTRRISQDF